MYKYMYKKKQLKFLFLFLLISIDVFNIGMSSTVHSSSEEQEVEQQYSQEIKSQYGTYEVLPLGNSNEIYQMEKRRMPHSELQQTGLFVKTGQTIEVTVNNENPDLTIEIGQYGSYSTLNNGEGVPFFWKKLHQGKNEITSEIDGMVYFKNRNVSLQSLVDVQGGQKVPYFIINSTSKEDWLEMIQTMKDAPFVELKGEKMIGTFQLTENKQAFSTIDVNELLKYWDEVVELSDEAYGFTRGEEGTFGKANHPIHITNPDSGAGWASATHYRLTFQVDTGAGNSVLTSGRENENWGLWHEIGHTYQTPEYIWYEMGEASVNISAGYISRHYGFESRWTSSGNARNKVASMKEYIESTEEKHFDEMPYDNDTNLWLKFGMLEQLAFAYGGEFFKYVSQEYRNLGKISVPSDNDKQQLFMKVTSKVTNRDLTEFFTKWGLYPNEETRSELSVYHDLEVPIWNNIIYDIIEDYKLSPYSPPTAKINGSLDYTVGMDDSEIDFTGVLTDIRNINGENSEIKKTLDVVHDFEKNASVGVILENSKGIRNRINLPINYNIGNAIVFKGYSNEQRLLLTLQTFNHTIETFTDRTLQSQFDSGDTHYSTITLLDSELKEIKKVEINKDQSPQEFVDVLSSIPYTEGMFLKIEMANAEKLQLNKQQELIMDFNAARKLEWFLISDNQFVRMSGLTADFKEGQTVIGEKIEAEDLIENITDSSEIGDYLVSYKNEPNWNKVGEQVVTIIIKNKIGQEIEVKGSILISYSNSISMRAYGNEERVVISTNKETGKFRSLSDHARTTIIESSAGQYAEVTLYDKNLTRKYQTATVKENPPFDFADSLDGISYEDGDYIKFIMYSNKKLEMYANGELSLKLEESNKEEWFQLIDHQFVRVSNIAPIAEPVTQTVLIGSKLSSSTFVKDIQDIFGEVEATFVSEPNWETFGEQKVKIRLTNKANIETIIESSLIVSRGNSISLRGYSTSDERALVFLNTSSEKIQTFANPNRESVVDSGSGLYWTLTHVSGETNEKIKEVSINREDTPFEFAESFSGMNYKNNDYVIVEHTRGSGFVRQYSENILLDQLFSKRELFVIKENRFIHVSSNTPTIQSDNELSVKQNSKLTEEEFLQAIHLETELENQILTNYNGDYLKVIGEYTIKIEAKNLITEETASKSVQLIVESSDELPNGALGINYVSNFNFGKKAISGSDKVYYAGLDSIPNELGESMTTPNFVSIEDNRETNEAWQLKVTQNGQFITDEEEELKGAELSFQDLNQMHDASNKLNLASNQALRIDHAVSIADASVGNGARNWSIAFGNTETGSKAIKLVVPGESKKLKDVQYKTTLTWDLGITPL